MDFFPKVLQAVPVGGYKVHAYMNDGTVRCFDAQPLIDKGGVFTQLRDKTLFSDSLTVLNDTVAWDISGKRDPGDCIDIDPFTVYEQPQVSDPLLGAI